MKKFIFYLSAISLTFTLNAQAPITVGMTGLQLRNAVNGNFDTLFAYLDSTKMGEINIKTYGAIGNGIADDRTAFINAINAAIAVNGTLFIPSGDYYISSNITFNISRKHIGITGSGNSRLISPSNITITFTSTPGTIDSLTANPVIGGLSVTTKTIHSSVIEGDILQIMSTDQYANPSVHYKGELAVVKSVSGSVISLYGNLMDSYRKETTIIQNMNSGSLKVSNMNFQKISLVYTKLHDNILANCNWNNSPLYPVIFYYCYNTLVTNNNFATVTLSGASQYAVSPAGVQEMTISNNKISNYYQALALGGMYPTRNVKILYNTIYALTGLYSQLDTHSDCENIQIIGNVIYGGGMYIKGYNIDISDNTCYIVTGSRGITRLIEQYRDDVLITRMTQYERIVNNQVYELNPYPNDFTTGINITWYALRDTTEWIYVAGNYVKVGGYAFLYNKDGGTGCLVRNMNITNNYFESISTTVAPIHFNGGIPIINMMFSNNVVKGKGVGLISGGGGVAQYISSINNEFHVGAGATTPYSLGASVDNIIQGNKFYGGGVILAGGRIRAKDNVFYNVPANITCWSIHAGVTSFYVENTQYINCLYGVRSYVEDPTIATINETVWKSAALTDGTPTDAEVTAAATLSAAILMKGYTVIIKDTNGTGLTYTYKSDGTNWILQGTPVKAL